MTLFERYREKEDEPFAIFVCKLHGRAGGGLPPPVAKAWMHIRLHLGMIRRMLYWVRIFFRRDLRPPLEGYVSRHRPPHPYDCGCSGENERKQMTPGSMHGTLPLPIVSAMLPAHLQFERWCYCPQVRLGDGLANAGGPAGFQTKS